MSSGSEELRQRLAAQQAGPPSQRDRLSKQLAAVERQISSRTARPASIKGTLPQRGMTLKPFKGGGRGKKG